MLKNDIVFNSWLNQYKKPFGSVEVNKEVRFAIDVDLPHVQSVNLMIHKDYGQQFEIMMKKNACDQYETEFCLSEGQGLYYYYFQINYMDHEILRTLYYGNNLKAIGGKGSVYEDQERTVHYQLTCYLEVDTAPQWYRQGTAYHVFVDRFYNGNENGTILNPKKNAFIYASNDDHPLYIKDNNGEIIRWEFFGGNLKGIIKKMPYLEQLGISIIYLSPIFEARSNHKYDTGDYLKIDSMFGDEETFIELINEGRKRGIKILLDGVFNHTGADSRYFNRFGNYDELGAFQSQKSPFFDWYTFENFPSRYLSWWGIEDLPTLNTKSPNVQAFIYEKKDSVVRKWSKLGIGGWRIDVADELTDFFLRGVRKALDESIPDAVLIGEVWEDASNKISYDQRRHYIEGGILHGVMNYPFRDMVIGVLNRTITPFHASQIGMSMKENYPKSAFESNFNNIGTHDTPRILTALNNEIPLLKLAFVMLIFLPGVPCIYYGDEVGIEGNSDPDNRRMYPWGKENNDIREHVTQLIALRKHTMALLEGDYYSFSNPHIFGMLRYKNDTEWIVLLINPHGEDIVFHTRLLNETFQFPISEFLIQQQLEGISVKAKNYYIKKPDSNNQLTRVLIK